MANQPPVRPWFRLASLRSVAPPPPASAQEPRPSLVQPTAPAAEKGSVPSSPAQKLPVLSSSSLPTSPVQKESVKAQKSAPSPPSASSPAKGDMAARGSSPSTKQVSQTPMQSPKAAKPTTPPPFPLTLPPSQLKANSETEPKIPVEAESKNVIFQKTIEKPNQKPHNEKHKGNHRKLSDSGDSVITIAGENRGAYMELIQSPKKHEFADKPNYLYQNGNSKAKSENGEPGSSSSDEGNGNKKQNKSSRGRTKSSYPMASFMNSNVQCVNNSLMYNASCSHHDPGVRLSLSKKPSENGGFHLREFVNGRHD